MTLKLKVIKIAAIRQAIYHFLLLFFMLHRFRCITTFIVYVTASDLEKSINFDFR